MWEIDNNLQISAFLFSVVLGVVFEFFYDVFRALRRAVFHKNIFVFFEDIIYFCIISVLSFIYFLSVTNGEIRGFVLLGILLGFLGLYFTLSRYISSALFVVIYWLIKLILSFKRAFYLLFSKIDTILTKFLKNTLVFLKKGLKKCGVLLYTNRK